MAGAGGRMSMRLVHGALWPLRVVGRMVDGVGAIVAGPELPSDLDARFALFGFAPAPVRMRVLSRAPVVRRVRAVTTLVGAAFLVPFAFLIPPHLESFLVAVGFTVYLVHREWNAEYVVLEGGGSCPACSCAIVLERESTLRLPGAYACGACGQHLRIEAGAAAGVATNRPRSAAAPVKLVADEVAIAAFWRRNQAASHSAWSPGSSSWRD